MMISVSFGSKYRFMFSLVSTEYQQICYIQKLQIQQYIFGLLTRETTAQDMRNHSNIIFILNGCRHSDCSRTPSQAVSLKEPVAEILDIFAAMRGDIDIFRIKFSKSVDCLIELFDSGSLQRRENFERKSCTFTVIY
jgi:hypothetical protein